MRKVMIAMIALLASASWCVAQSTCATLSANSLSTYPPWDPYGNQGHNTGEHQFGTNSAATCSYSSIGGPYCASVCNAYGSASGTDTGLISNPLYSHRLGAQVNPGTSSANGAQIQCGATAAVTVVSCLVGTSCGTSITFSREVSGIGVTVSFPPNNIFSISQPYTNTCALQADPAYGDGGCAAWQAAHKNGAQDAPPPGCGGTEPDCGDDGEDPCCYCPGSGANPSLPLCGDCGDSAALMDPGRFSTPASCLGKRPRKALSDFLSTLDR